MRRGDVTRDDALAAIESALLPLDELVPSGELRLRALAMALELDHPVTDCLYLALAEREQCPLVTADRKLMAAAKTMKSVEVRGL